MAGATEAFVRLRGKIPSTPLVLKEAMQSNNTASLNVLLTVIKDDHINVRDLILAVIERQEKNLER